MSNLSLRHIEILLDRSGSMLDIKSDAEGGLRAFLAEQRKVQTPTTVTLWQFDHHIETVFEIRPLAHVPSFRLRPRGQTALRDAVGRAIDRLHERLLDTPSAWRPEEVIVVIVTDGKDNASHTYDRNQVRQMIGRCHRDGWQFVYVGAGPDAFAEAGSIGIDRDTTLIMNRDHTKASMTSASRMVSRGTETGSFSFTDDERDNSA